MSLLIDLFGYLSIVIHGLTITAQSIALGGVLFIALLMRPLVSRLGSTGQAIERTCVSIAAWSALAMVLCEVATVTLQSAVLVGTVDLSIADALRANFAIAGLVKASAAGLIALTLFALGQRAPVLPLLALAVIELAAATLTTHAEARLDNRTPLLLVEFLHQFGAAIWIGGIPCFLVALNRVQNAQSWRLIGARFSRMSMAGVACIVVSGLTMSLGYIGDWEGFYGTAYGVMVGAKIAMFLMLLGLGGGNFLLIERLRTRPTHAGHAVEAVRRGGDRHRRGDLLRRRLADFGAAGDRSHAGPRQLVGYNSSATRQSGRGSPRRTTTRWRCRHCRRSWMPRRRTAARWRRWRLCQDPATCRHATPPTSPGRNTTITGRDCSCWRSACCRC